MNDRFPYHSGTYQEHDELISVAGHLNYLSILSCLQFSDSPKSNTSIPSLGLIENIDATGAFSCFFCALASNGLPYSWKFTAWTQKTTNRPQKRTPEPLKMAGGCYMSDAFQNPIACFLFKPTNMLISPYSDVNHCPFLLDLFPYQNLYGYLYLITCIDSSIDRWIDT